MADAKTFVERTKKNVKEVCDPLVSHILLTMWEEDLPAYDVNYIENRVRKILDDKLKQCKFKNKAIKEARLKALDNAIKDVSGAESAIDNDKDSETDFRNKRCEKVAQEIVKTLLSPDFIKADKEYFEDAIEQDDLLLLENRLRGFVGGIFDGLVFSISTSLTKANTKLWGVEKEKITMKQLDNILKSK
jgi:hypothetical protein